MTGRCVLLLLLLALVAGSRGGRTPRPPRPCHRGTARTTTDTVVALATAVIDSSPAAASAAAATPAAAATLASQGAGAASTHPHREKHRGDVSWEGVDAYLMAKGRIVEAPVTYFLTTGLAPVNHVRWRNATTAAAAGGQWQQPHQRSERSCLGCLSGGVSGGRSIGLLRVAGGRQRRRWSQHSELIECPRLDSLLYSLLGGLLNGGESGGRSTGPLRVAGGQARW